MEQEKILKKILDGLNAGRGTGYFFKRPLADNVDQARIWMEKPTPERPVFPITAYLIRSDKKYAGGVLASESLYAYMLTSMRRKSIMSTALRNIILPHFLQQRAIVRVSLSKAQLGERNYISARRLANAVGFEPFREQDNTCKFMIDASGLKQRELIKGVNIPFSDKDLERLKNHLLYALSHVQMIRTELEFRQGISAASEDLRELFEALREQAEKLPGAWFEGKGK